MLLFVSFRFVVDYLIVSLLPLRAGFAAATRNSTFYQGTPRACTTGGQCRADALIEWRLEPNNRWKNGFFPKC